MNRFWKTMKRIVSGGSHILLLACLILPVNSLLQGKDIKSKNDRLKRSVEMVEISKHLPAGNIHVLEIKDHTVLLKQEQRDSSKEWFYWKFKAVFKESGKWHFRFVSPYKVGTRGPAVSLDRGKSWQWQPNSFVSHSEFTFECHQPGEVWFCQGLPYLQQDWDRFTAEFSRHPAVNLSMLCRSRKGRSVELLEINEGTPQLTVILTARHHCQEMSASMVLEGILRHVLANDENGRNFRRKIRLYTIPFTDKDGVEDGDQGKSRTPRDHARDYQGGFIYPETAAIWKLIKEKEPFLVIDLHAPWIFGQHNENAYLVENRNKRFLPEIDKFAKLLEAEAPACAPFLASDTVRWGTGWNSNANYDSRSVSGIGLNLSTACGQLPFIRMGVTIEIPFANFREKTMTKNEFLQFGSAIARTILRYSEEKK